MPKPITLTKPAPAAKGFKFTKPVSTPGNRFANVNIAPRPVPTPQKEAKVVFMPRKQPTKVAKKAVVAPIPVEVADSLLVVEKLRVTKNSWTNKFNKAEKGFKKLFLEKGCEKLEMALEVPDIDGKMRSVKVTAGLTQTSTISVPRVDVEAFKKNASPEILKKCLVVDPELVKEFAGTALLKKCTVLEEVTVEGGKVYIESEKVTDAEV